MLELNKIYCMDNVQGMKQLDNESVDLVVTSPPYDNLRNYNEYSFDFENVAKELYRITKQGGVVVWVVGDATIDGNETGTSFRQALFFKEIGFNLFDTMIYEKPPRGAVGNNLTYWQTFEYMFVLSKGQPKTINLIRDRKNLDSREGDNGTKRLVDGTLLNVSRGGYEEYGIRTNIWRYNIGKGHSTKDDIAFKHPAIFPESLAGDHIKTWSNEGDIVFDPFMGSGTTAKVARSLGRKYIGFEISQEYVDLANKRLQETKRCSINIIRKIMKHTIADVQKVNPEFRLDHNRVGLFNSHFQNFKQFGVPKAQLILTDIPYNIGKNAYASNPSWYEGGSNENGESELAGQEFFDTDKDFRPAEFMHFCSQMLRPEPKEKGKAPCMIVFCEFEQQFMLIELARRYGLNNYINLVFRKNYSAQVLKANMRVVGNCEYGLILFRDKLPKFNNNGQMVFNCMDYPRDLGMPRTHATQKSIPFLKRLVELFTDVDDVVIDPCAGSGSTLIAAASLDRKAYGFEIKKNFYTDACNNLSTYIQHDMFSTSKSRSYYTPKQVLQAQLQLESEKIDK